MAPPPGYVAYGGTGAAMSDSFSKVGGLSKALGILLMIFIPLQVLGVFSLFSVRDKAREFLNGEISEKKFTDATQANVGSLAGLLIIPIAVLTIMVMFRMAKNLRVLGRTNATWKPGWGIAGWFCPPCAVYAIPWLMLRELWKGSDANVAPNDPSWKAGSVSPLVNVWWVLYGLVPLVGLATSAGFISSINNFEAEEVAERFDDYLAINVVLALVQVVAAVVYLLLIRQLSARHMGATREA
jgi:Domain of unknown function (DUF4328)